MNTLNSKVNKKKTVFKTVFDSPHTQWPKIDKTTSQDILTRTLTEFPHIKASLVVGLNEVTRCLESRALAVVLVCREDLQYPQVVAHLPFQGHLAGALVIDLPKESAGELSVLFGIKHVSVVGVKREPVAGNFINYLEKSVPPIEDLSEYRSLVINRIPIEIKKKKRNNKM